MQNSHNELLIVLNMIEEKSSENIASNDKNIGYTNGYLVSCQVFSFFSHMRNYFTQSCELIVLIESDDWKFITC